MMQTLLIAVIVALGAALVQADRNLIFPAQHRQQEDEQRRQAKKTVTVDFSGQTQAQKVPRSRCW